MKCCLKSNCCPSKLKRNSRLSFLSVCIISPVAINLSMFWITSTKSSVVLPVICTVDFCSENVRNRRKNIAVSTFSWLISILHAKFCLKQCQISSTFDENTFNEACLVDWIVSRCVKMIVFTDAQRWQIGSTLKRHMQFKKFNRSASDVCTHTYIHVHIQIFVCS